MQRKKIVCPPEIFNINIQTQLFIIGKIVIKHLRIQMRIKVGFTISLQTYFKAKNLTIYS